MQIKIKMVSPEMDTFLLNSSPVIAMWVFIF
jgi:hypothetical protein